MLEYELNKDGTLTVCGCSNNLEYVEVNSSVPGFFFREKFSEISLDNTKQKEIAALFGGIFYKSVTRIGFRAFASHYNLISVCFSKPLSIIEDEAFIHCEEMVRIILPNTVKTIGQRVFSFCRSLEDIELPNSVMSIGSEAFLKCEDLKRIRIPGSVKMIGDDAFKDCKKVTLFVERDSCAAEYAQKNGIQFVDTGWPFVSIYPT